MHFAKEYLVVVLFFLTGQLHAAAFMGSPVYTVQKNPEDIVHKIGLQIEATEGLLETFFAPIRRAKLQCDDDAAKEVVRHTASLKELVGVFPQLKEEHSKAVLSLTISTEWCLLSNKFQHLKPQLESLSKRALLEIAEAEKSPVLASTASPWSDSQVVVKCGIAETQNEKYRSKMEDRVAVLDDPSSRFAIFAVYDGHSGVGVVEYLAANLNERIRNGLEAIENISNESVGQCIEKIFLETDDSLCKNGIKAGSTALVAIVDKKDHAIHIANLGDSRALLCRPTIAPVFRQLSHDHKASDILESQRFQAAGGYIFYAPGDCAQARVFGELAITRTFGDFKYKDCLTDKTAMSKPEIMHRMLQDYDQYLVLATDGLWDELSNVEVASNIIKNKDSEPQVIAQNLVQLAVKKGSQDNITVLVAQFSRVV